MLELERIIKHRYEFPSDESYVNRLRSKGINKIAQKVGEEAVETVIAALAETEHDFINETSDLFFHLLVLLREKGVSLETIAKNLESRHQ
ncbi:Phosphoribosyl-ATP pyrophosphatase [compost metagenome]